MTETTKGLNRGLVDHTPLIYPLRSASELVETAIPGHLLAVRFSEWRPIWLKHAIKEVRDGKSSGFAFPDIHLAAIYTNSLLKSAGAYHELKGHINTLLGYALPMCYCLVYHDRLFRSISRESTVSLDTLLSTVGSILNEEITHELLADRAEIDVLRPYINHEHFGRKVKERIHYLENLDAKEDWCCDMHGGPLCAHRAGIYISHLLTTKLNATPAEIGQLAFGISNKLRAITSRPGTFPTEGEIPIPADTALMNIARRLGEFQHSKKEEIVVQLETIMSQVSRKVAEEGGNPDLPGKSSIPVSTAHFVKNHPSLFEAFTRSEEINRKKGGFAPEYLELLHKPLSTMIAKSFIVATRDELALYLPKEVLPTDERLRALSTNALVDLKLLTIITYDRVNPLVEKNWIGCPSRSGSTCLFRERLEYPSTSLHLERVKTVLNCLRDDPEVRLVCERIFKTLRQILEARDRKSVKAA
jgi:hypothetical protein